MANGIMITLVYPMRSKELAQLQLSRRIASMEQYRAQLHTRQHHNTQSYCPSLCCGQTRGKANPMYSREVPGTLDDIGLQGDAMIRQ